MIKEAFLRNDVKSPTVVTLSSNIHLEESFLASAYDFIAECTVEFADSKKTFIRNLYEAGSSSILIQEASEGFFGTIKNIIDKFLNFIKRIFDKFCVMLNKIVKSDKYIKKHQKAFDKFSIDDEFDYSAFVYSFDPAIPVISTDSITRWKKDTGYEFNNPKFLPNTDHPDENAKKDKDNIALLQVRYDAIKANSTGDGLDSQRGAILGRSTPIDASDWSKELFKQYRSDEDKESTIHVSHDVVREALNRFNKYSDTISSIEKEKRNIEKEYSNLKKSVKEVFSSAGYENLLGSSSGLDFQSIKAEKDPTIVKKLDTMATEFINIIMAEIQNLSNLHSAAFAAKLDAVKECFLTDKRILYKALSKVVKHDRLKESYKEDDDDDDYDDDDDDDITSIPVRDTDGYNDEYDPDSDEFFTPLPIKTTTEPEVGEHHPKHYDSSDPSLQNKDTISERDIVGFHEAFLQSKMLLHNAQIMNYLKEAVCFEDGNLNELATLNEGVVEAFKNAIKKIIDTIAGLFRKFAESMSNVFSKNAAYLKKYKYIFDSPSKYPVLERDIQIYEYKKDNITKNFEIPPFDYPSGKIAKMMEIGKGDDDYKQAFINTYYSGLVKYDKDQSIEEMVMAALRGDQEVAKSTTDLDYTAMYNFVVNSSDTIDHINKMSSQINNNKTNLDNILKKLEEELDAEKKESEKAAKAKEEEDAKEENKENGEDSDKGGGDGSDKGNRSAPTITQVETVESAGPILGYSYLYESVLNELVVDKKSSGTAKSSSDISKSTEPGTQGIKTGDDADGTKATIKAGLDAKAGENGTYEQKLEELKKVQELAEAFFTDCGYVCAAKLTVVTTMWKEYFQLLRLHVKDYVKENPNDTSSTKK